MSAFNGTPGPWEIGEALCSHAPAVIGDGDSVVCEFSGRVGASVCTDARLIAASPDLLDSNLKFVEAVDALYNITPAWIDDCIYDELPSSGLALAYFAARAAIAKATGGAA